MSFIFETYRWDWSFLFQGLEWEIIIIYIYILADIIIFVLPIKTFRLLYGLTICVTFKVIRTTPCNKSTRLVFFLVLLSMSREIYSISYISAAQWQPVLFPLSQNLYYMEQVFN